MGDEKGAQAPLCVGVGITISSGAKDCLDWSEATTNPRNPLCTFFEYYGPAGEWSPENNGDVTKPSTLRGMLSGGRIPSMPVTTVIDTQIIEEAKTKSPMIHPDRQRLMLGQHPVQPAAPPAIVIPTSIKASSTLNRHTMPRKFGNGGLGKFSLVLADGGFSVDGDEANQELRHIRLVLSQFLFGTVCTDGTQSFNKEKATKSAPFVCKIFDQRFFLSNYLILVLSQFFRECVIDKISQTRPASAERYVYFFDRRPDGTESAGVSATPTDDDSVPPKLLQWLFALFFAIDKFVSLGKASRVVPTHTENSQRSRELSKQDYLEILNSLPFEPPIPVKACKQFVLWEHLMKAQNFSEELQGEYLIAIHEVMALFDTFAEYELRPWHIRKQLRAFFLDKNNAINTTPNTASNGQWKRADILCQEKIGQWTNCN